MNVLVAGGIVGANWPTLVILGVLFLVLMFLFLGVGRQETPGDRRQADRSLRGKFPGEWKEVQVASPEVLDAVRRHQVERDRRANLHLVSDLDMQVAAGIRAEPIVPSDDAEWDVEEAMARQRDRNGGES